MLLRNPSRNVSFRKYGSIEETSPLLAHLRVCAAPGWIVASDSAAATAAIHDFTYIGPPVGRMNVAPRARRASARSFPPERRRVARVRQQGARADCNVHADARRLRARMRASEASDDLVGRHHVAERADEGRKRHHVVVVAAA